MSYNIQTQTNLSNKERAEEFNTKFKMLTIKIEKLNKNQSKVIINLQSSFIMTELALLLTKNRS